MSLFSKFSEKTRLVFLLFLGPLFFLLSIGLAYINKIEPHYDLWALFFLSIGFISLFYKKGLYISLFLTLSLAIVHHNDFSCGPLWMSFWTLSLFSSLWVNYLGQNELQKKFEFFHLEQVNMKDNFSICEQEMGKELNEEKNQKLLLEETISKKEDEIYQIKQKYQSSQTLVEILRKEDTHNFDERESLINECMALRKKVASLEENVHSLESKSLSQASSTVDSSNQTIPQEEIDKITKAYEELLEENRLLKDQNTSSSKPDLKKHEAEIKKYQSLYYQLHNQFEGQKIHIHEARKELFLTQEKLSALDKEKEMNEIDLNEKDKTIEKMLMDYMSAVQNHEEEIESLEKIITILNQKSKRKTAAQGKSSDNS